MASVKKTMKSSKTKQANKTKQAKRPGTPKAKASKQSAVLKAKRAAAARALAARKLATSKPGRKAKIKTAVVTAKRPLAVKPAARKKVSAARAALRASNTIRAAKKGAKDFDVGLGKRAHRFDPQYSGSVARAGEPPFALNTRRSGPVVNESQHRHDARRGAVNTMTIGLFVALGLVLL
jgi:hypothetical protein